MERAMEERPVKFDPKVHRKYVINENGKLVLYVELLKVLYGMLRAALLFWRKFCAALFVWGFEINLYAWCGANKIIDGKQCAMSTI